jgi:hypothetical protein
MASGSGSVQDANGRIRLCPEGRGFESLTQLPQACCPCQRGEVVTEDRPHPSPIRREIECGLGHPDGHPVDPSGSVGTRPDRRGIQRELGEPDWRRPVRLEASGS